MMHNSGVELSCSLEWVYFIPPEAVSRLPPVSAGNKEPGSYIVYCGRRTNRLREYRFPEFVMIE